jgi:hypothetical protein
VLPAVDEWGALLCAGPVGLSVEHNDLHDNNTFQPGTGAAPLRFFDFGDALWAHPFSTLRITLNVIQSRWDTTVDDRRVRYVIDAYLDSWSDLAPKQELHELLNAAVAIGAAHRFVSWHRVLDYADADELAEDGEMPGIWLDVLAQPPAAVV